MSTKKLAKELGLLRQRSQSSNGSKKSLLSREVESEFHTYVQPQEHPMLSEFCTELTGITQMQVEAGIPLQICLSRFSRWLQNLQLEKGVVFPNRQQRSSAPSPSQKLCTFLTWSDWDLGVCLHYECKRKQLHKPDVLNSWIDLRSTYRLFYDRKPKGLNGALQDLGIQFSGREHSGLDDSRNTAHLAARMMRDGCVMKITRSLERTPSVVRPMFGNTATESKKEKPINNKEENTLNKPSSSKTPPESCQIKSCAEDIKRDLDTKENSSSVQSLIAPKTLLNGATTPLWGRGRSVTAVTANISTSVMMNRPSPPNNNNSLVLFSTTVDCISNLPRPNHPPGAAVGCVEEEEGVEIFVETEDRCGSYDDVVLEDDDDVISETLGEFKVGYVSDFDSGCHVWEQPDDTHSPGDQVTLRDNIRGTVSVENSFKTPKIISESSVTSLLTKKMTSSVNVSNQLNKIRQNSAVSEPNVYFAVPKTVTREPKSNQHKTVPQEHKKSYGPHKNSQLITPFLLRHKPFIPEKTSTPYTSFARPKAVVTQHTNHKEIPKSSFTIYTDPAIPSHPSSCGSFSTSRNVLSSLSTNTLSSCTNRSSVSVTMKGGQRITSPLCACGRRAKRQVVSNGGPNHGRGFYCCPVHRSGSGGRIQKGCEFFKWESALMKNSPVSSPAVGSSVSLCQINSTLSWQPPQRSMLRKSC
uniref:ERI1 exoribonuclease 2 isoform X3 n=1 Tax=Epinephelus lanceolatus TaxID=310571 RepID=UPI001444E251|nr:ERI1 exoribonuclease 2 isoform X3 [Epinephelus lanceolatus]